MVLGQETISQDNFGGFAPILLPMLIAGVGILFSIIGTFFVREVTVQVSVRIMCKKH
jgi:K(+)-stimulated pyrophosphate-energized sodium pump